MQRSFTRFLPLITWAAIASCAPDGTGSPLATTAPAPTAVSANQGQGDDNDFDNENGVARGGPFTFAVIGDTPYGPIKLAEFPALTAKINADPKVRLVTHLGDIKAGSNAACTDEYFTMIRGLFDQFADPIAYTPGDNEWTDCHVAGKNNGLFTPTERLQRVRSLFFPVPGRTLGRRTMRVVTEANDPANSAYVENTLWEKRGVVFAMINVQGSNNDGAPWGAPLPADAANYQSQADEQVTRARANKAWIEKAFAAAKRTDAPGIILLFQADMWDATQATLTGFDALVQQIGAAAKDFRKPVLLLEGDSHMFRVDNPYSVGSALHTLHPSTPVADNVTRVVVEGSDAGGTEYLRLTIDPRKKGTLFSWERVPLN
jgi:hypothetical protein